MRVVCDIEANGLLHTATKIWCIVCLDVDTRKIYRFSDSVLTKNKLSDFPAFAEKVTEFIGHNFIGYDMWVLNNLLGTRISYANVTDTLVLSRLLDPQQPLGHSLERWARFLKLPIQKQEHEDWSKFSPEMLDRCTKDVKINYYLYNHLKPKTSTFSDVSIDLEHKMQAYLTENSIYGVKINTKKAMAIHTECSAKALAIESTLDVHFPPEKKLIRNLQPRMTADGRLHKTDARTIDSNITEQLVDGSYNIYKMIPFNPSSPTQVVARLDAAGWDPIDFNKLGKKREAEGHTKGTPKINERNLDTIRESAPQEAKLIRDFLMLTDRAKVTKQWLDCVDDNDRLHGQVISVGAWTQRCSHSNPNTANIPSVKFDPDTNEVLHGEAGRYGWECRDCWTVEEGRRLVGVDAAGIQLRILAHYMDDPDYTDTILNGDIHSLHRDLLGLSGKEGRSKAKTFIYAWLLGAGTGKISNILNCSSSEAKARVNQFLDRLPKLAALKRRQERDVQRGWFKGLDGRRVPAPSNHLVMAGYLQSGEAIVMKSGYCWSTRQFKERGLDCHIVSFVHDEFQADSLLTNAEECGMILKESIDRTTNLFNLKCPMEGETPKIGLSWAETH